MMEAHTHQDDQLIEAEWGRKQNKIIALYVRSTYPPTVLISPICRKIDDPIPALFSQLVEAKMRNFQPL